MKNFNALSEEDLNKASGGLIFHDPKDGSYIVGEFVEENRIIDEATGEVIDDGWTPEASTFKKENAIKIAKLLGLSTEIRDLHY